jgi:hypothetical protein
MRKIELENHSSQPAVVRAVSLALHTSPSSARPSGDTRQLPPRRIGSRVRTLLVTRSNGIPSCRRRFFSLSTSPLAPFSRFPRRINCPAILPSSSSPVTLCRHPLRRSASTSMQTLFALSSFFQPPLPSVASVSSSSDTLFSSSTFGSPSSLPPSPHTKHKDGLRRLKRGTSSPATIRSTARRGAVSSSRHATAVSATATLRNGRRVVPSSLLG